MYLCITIYTYIQDYIHIIEKEKINRTRSPPVVHQATEHAPGTSTKASVDFATGTTGENGFDASGSSLVFHMPHGKITGRVYPQIATTEHCSKSLCYSIMLVG